MPEAKGAFAGFIGPRNLLRLVENTAPWIFAAGGPLPSTSEAPEGASLIDLGAGPHGWLRILRAGERLQATETPGPEEWLDYFALCVAAHFGSVATFVPTDVDTKIRDRLWFLRIPTEALERLVTFALGAREWDVSSVSRRITFDEIEGAVSGHDGEWLSIACGAAARLAAAGDEAGAERVAAVVDDELAREARAFDRATRARGRGIDLLWLASSLTHNAGDVDQGLSARAATRFVEPLVERFGRLAHERKARYGGAFARAARVYKALLAAEGHRHYPLREIRPLRVHPDLLLPLGPCLDAWGERLGTWPGWRGGEVAEIVEGLLHGIRRVRGQEGYFRALAGLDRTVSGGLWGKPLQRQLSANTKKALRDKVLRRKLSVPRESFEASLLKRARDLIT